MPTMFRDCIDTSKSSEKYKEIEMKKEGEAKPENESKEEKPKKKPSKVIAYRY